MGRQRDKLEKSLGGIADMKKTPNMIFIIDTNVEDLAVKEALKLNTEELAKRGGFGSPTMFVKDKNMFFGNDRLNLIEELLNR